MSHRATRSPRRPALVVLSSLTAIALLALSASPASAKTEFHAFAFSFGEAGEGNGQLALTHFRETGDYRTFGGSEIAINQETGNVYVTDTGNKRVEEFSETGTFIRTFGTFNSPTFIAVDNSGGPSQGDVYVADSVAGTVSKFEPDGTPVSGWGTSGQLTGLSYPQGIAVGAGGDLFVRVEFREGLRYKSDGSFVGSFEAPRASFGGGLAIDAEGHLYQVDSGKRNKGEEGREVTKFTDTGESLGYPDGELNAIGLAIDPSSNDLYVLHPHDAGFFEPGGFVSHFALNCGSLLESCTPLDAFEQGRFSSPQGIAINATTHRIYVGDTATQEILVFAPAPGVPLTVEKPGTGIGTVSSVPLIRCGPACSATYAESSPVRLTAKPNERTTFSGWGAGDCDSEPTADECEVEMGAARTVRAEFAAIQQAKLTVAPTGNGTGTVTGSSPGAEFTPIQCGATCEAEYNQGTTVTLTANPDIGSSLAHWTNCKSEPTPLKCVVEMNATKTVEAEFVVSEGHIFSIDIAGSGPTALSGPTEVAVDQTSHDIYVNDPGHYRVEKFSPSGNFILMFGREVDQTTGGDTCSAASGDSCQFGSPGVEPGQFREPAVLAVDNSGGPSNGDVYVGDPQSNFVQKFDSAGHIVTGWGASGQKEGTDAVEEFPHHFTDINGLDVNNAGELYVDANQFREIFVFAQNGNYLRKAASNPKSAKGPGFKVGPDENFFETNDIGAFAEGQTAVIENLNGGDPEQTYPVGRVTSIVDTTGFAFDPVDHSLYQDVAQFNGNSFNPENITHGPGIEAYDPACDAHEGVCEPVESFGNGHIFGAKGLSIDGSNSTVYVANSETNDVAVFLDARPTVSTGPIASSTETSATLSGNVDPESHGVNHGPVSDCEVIYGFTRAYGHSAPCEPDASSGAFTSSTPVTATVSGLTPLKDLPNGTEYHYRFLATNEVGAVGRGTDHVFRTTAPARIEGLSSSHITATSAELDASIDPHGLPTSYTFEYGSTATYGQTVSGEISGSLAELSHVRPIVAHLEGLQSGVNYHFRLVAHNADSVSDSVSEDQTFEFFPPSCPNSAVRQQTGAAYLPDCRAYELVSPADAGGTLYYPGGPNTGLATSPSRFAYTGLFAAPEGVNPINTAGDLYVATRTSSGWVSKYIGLTGDKAGCIGGPPTDPRTEAVEDPRQITNTVLTDSSMNLFLDFLDGTATACTATGPAGFTDQDVPLAKPSNAPFEWAADGNFEERLPAGIGKPATVAALECPYATNTTAGTCSGETTASGDLSHLVFSSASMSFSGPGEPTGLTAAPGSAYEENLATGKVSLISKLPAALGEGPIPEDPNFASVPTTFYPRDHAGGSEEFIRFPAVSRNGSHILMSTATAGVPLYCHSAGSSYACPRYVDYPLHLYMRIGGGEGGETYEIAEDTKTHEPAVVSYVGMTPDGSEVFFTSEEHLTGEDLEHGGASLYMWSAEKAENEEQPLTLISKGPSETPGAPGNSADCNAAIAPINGNPTAEKYNEFSDGKGGYRPSPWTTSCGVQPYSGYGYSWLAGGRGGSGFEGSFGGSGFSPDGISQNGDIYFYSPERLDGIHGAPGQQNLFLYRNGQLQYVTTLKPERRCGPNPFSDENHCSGGPVVRLQTNSDDTRMAFITASQITPYDNAGHLEMYTYTPGSEEILCVSCNPSGQPPTADVYGSEDGLFMTEDGRVFFSTTESLVPRDTNEGEDVYEYVTGRPQLITPGTGTATEDNKFAPGLVGVSADGTDVFFSTRDKLIPGDQNGSYLRFYDARANGGFPSPPPAQPCAAAEECHGPGTEAPVLPAQATAAGLTGGNVKARAAKSHHRAEHRKKTKKRSHRHHAAHRGGGK